MSPQSGGAGDPYPGDWFKWKDDLLTAVGAAYTAGQTKAQIGDLTLGHPNGNQTLVTEFNAAWSECAAQDAKNTRDGTFFALSNAFFDALASGESVDSVRVRGRGGAF